MKVIAVNGSPRKNWNTSILLQKALEGAASEGASVELINLYDLEYKGCSSCLLCKAKNSKSLGRCAMHDELKPVLDSIDVCDGLILGSPIFFGDISATMRAFLERLLFQYLSYDNYSETYYKASLKVAFMYTMNVSEDMLSQTGIDVRAEHYKSMMDRYFTYVGTLFSTETLQVKDYNKYHMAQFDGQERMRRRLEVFPSDCQRAYDLGKSLCSV